MKRIKFNKIPVIFPTKLEDLDFPKIRYLSGVTQIDYITGTYNGITRKFYLFHDRHNTIGECPSTLENAARVNDWLLQKLSHHSKFIDLFLEVTPNRSIREKFAKKFFPDPETRADKRALKLKYLGAEWQGTLVNLRKDLEPCYNYNLFSKCPYQDVRVHFVDIRSLHRRFESDVIPMSIFLWNVLGDSEMTKSDYITFIMENYVDNPESKIYQEWTKTDFTNWKPMVAKLLGIHYDKNDFAFDTILSGDILRMKRKHRLTRLTYKNIPKEVKEYILNSELSEVYEHEAEILKIVMFAPLQDIYALARMFKRFSGEPEYAKNIIYYAGNAHSYLIQAFLLEVLGLKLEYTTRYTTLDRVQCVDIQNLPWVF